MENIYFMNSQSIGHEELHNLCVKPDEEINVPFAIQSSQPIVIYLSRGVDGISTGSNSKVQPPEIIKTKQHQQHGNHNASLQVIYRRYESE